MALNDKLFAVKKFQGDQQRDSNALIDSESCSLDMSIVWLRIPERLGARGLLRRTSCEFEVPRMNWAAPGQSMRGPVWREVVEIESVLAQLGRIPNPHTSRVGGRAQNEWVRFGVRDLDLRLN